jgi:hypothetical protein
MPETESREVMKGCLQNKATERIARPVLIVAFKYL